MPDSYIGHRPANSFRQRSTFPGSLPPSIIDAKELNFRVRHGYGWFLFAIITGSSSDASFAPSKLNNSFLRNISLLTLFSSRFLLGQALDLLVQLSLMRYRTYTRCLSTI